MNKWNHWLLILTIKTYKERTLKAKRDALFPFIEKTHSKKEYKKRNKIVESETGTGPIWCKQHLFPVSNYVVLQWLLLL